MVQTLAEFPVADSPLRRLDPRWKLIGVVSLAAAAVGLRRLEPCLLAAGTGMVLFAASRLPWVWFRPRLVTLGLSVLPFLLALPVLGPDPGWSLGPVRVSLPGLHAAGVVAAKAVTITTLAVVLIGTSPPGSTLKAAQQLRVPGLLIQLTVLTSRYVLVLADELARLRIALRVRAYRHRATSHSYRTVGHVTGTLLVRGAERAERIGQAMRCRGFAGRFHALATFNMSGTDVAVGTGLVGVAAGWLLVDAWLGW